MEAKTDIQEYMESGRQALAQGDGRKAGLAFAHAAQIDGNNPAIHLGLAEANLALGNYGVVSIACRKVQELQQSRTADDQQQKGDFESTMAQTLLDLLDRRYERALQNVDTAITLDPGNGYAHALRAYLLQVNGQSYDAGLARSRAARLSYGGRYENVFPPIEKAPVYSSGLPPMPAEQVEPASANGYVGTQAQREPVAPWTQRGPMQKQMVRTRFAISRNPRFVTNVIIGINVIIFVIFAILSRSILDVTQTPLFQMFAQDNQAIMQHPDQFWRIFTAMFLHFSIIHIGLNMLSLFFIGTVVEVFYGKWRYLAIYLGSGILGGIVTFFLTPDALAAGASGAIFGVFGALGVFYLINRRALGAYGSGAIMNWLFWLVLNLVWGFSSPGIGIWDHIGGLAAGIVIAFLLLPKQRLRRLG